MNYSKGDTDLLKYDNIEDCLRFFGGAISDTWDLGIVVRIPFFRQYILSLSVIPNALLNVISSFFFFFSFTFFHWFWF